MKFEELKKQAAERIEEIKSDYKRHYTETLANHNINTAVELCNDCVIYELAWAWEVSWHCINLLENIENDSIEYHELSEVQMLLVEQANQMDWIMRWYDGQQYSPDASRGEAIDDWLLGCLEKYQNEEAD